MAPLYRKRNSNETKVGGREEKMWWLIALFKREITTYPPLFSCKKLFRGSGGLKKGLRMDVKGDEGACVYDPALLKQMLSLPRFHPHFDAHYKGSYIHAPHF